MKGIFLIGVGGCGRGALNWVKYLLERKYGSLEARGVRILVIDGPEKDQYILPGEYQIDTSDNSRDFYRLYLSPAGVIKAISSGRHVPFMSDWLSQRDAQRIPNQSSMNPRAGGGGSRATGRATFYIHAHDLERELREGLDEAVGYLPRSAGGTDADTGSGQAIAVLNFSAVGAMGAGGGFDNAHLIKSVKDENVMLAGVIALPNAYDAVLSDPAGRRKRDAKFMALLRELIRFQHADDFPTRISYTHSISVKNDQLFGLCFLIDGVASDLSLNDVHPKYGVCAAVADLEMALVLDDQHIIPDLANWVASTIGIAGEGKRFAAFGVHSYIFPRNDLVDTFSLRFARDLYEMLVTPPEEARDEGRQLADGMLEDSCFTRSGLRLAEGEELAFSPPVNDKARPHLMELIGSFTVRSSEAGSFPSGKSQSRILELSKEIKTRRSLLFPIHNQEVIDGCQGVAARYMGGMEDKPGRSTVWGWVNRQVERIERKFQERLRQDIKGIFYDPKTGNPILLSTKPYVLVVGRDYLLRTREVVELFELEARDAYTRWVDDEEVVEKQRQKVEALERELSSAAERNSQLQEEYIRQYQRLLELEIWGVMVKAYADLAARLRSIADKWWREIGEPTQSWYAMLRETLEHLDDQLRDLISTRTGMARVKVRRYFPFPGDAAEQAIYAELVEERHNELLRQMSFSFYSTQRERLDEASQEEGVYRLYLNVPDVQGYDSKVDTERMYDAVRGRYTNLRVEGHSPYKIEQYGRNFLTPSLGEIHLPEAMLHDYEHCWRPLRQEKGGGLKAYVAEIASTLSEKSHVFLSLRPSGDSEAKASVPKVFCLGHFRHLPNAEANSADELATLFAQEMGGRTGIHEIEEMEDMVICLNFQLGVSIHDWAYYPRCMSQYREYLRDPEAEPIQIYPEEQSALELEKLLEEERLMDNGYLSSSVVKYLGRLGSFSDFSISYALGLLEVEHGEMNEPDEYVVRATAAGSGQLTVSLGKCHELASVMGEYLAPENEAVRAAVKDKLQSHLREREKECDVAGVIEELRSAAKEVHVPEASVNHGHLRLAIQGCIYRFIRTVESNQQHRVPPKLTVGTN